MFFYLENAKTRYNIMKKKALTVVYCLAKVKWLPIIETKYFTKL